MLFGTSHISSRLLLAAITMTSAFLPGHAAAAGLGDSIIGLNEVQVTAKRRPLATVQKLQGAELQALSSTSIADALKYFAGVQIKDYGGLGGMKTLNVRSLGAQHVGVYIDGIRLTNAQNGTVDLGKYSLSTLQSVSLFNGHNSGVGRSPSEFASGATVYLQTRRPQADSLTVLGGIASFHSYRGRITGEFNRRGWSGFVEGEYLNSKGDYPFRYRSQYEDTTGRRRNSDIEFMRVEAALFNKGFASHFYFYNSVRGCPGGIVSRLSDRYVNVGREWDRDMFLQASWTHSVGSRHHIRINAKYARELLRYKTDFPENNNTARFDNHYRQNDAYVAASYALHPWTWLSVSTGYDARMSWLNADLKHFSPVRRFDQKAVIAAQFSYRDLRVAVSGLYQYYKDHTRVHAGAADPLSRFTPSVSVGYDLFGVSLRGWYKRIFRMPTLNDLYYTQSGNRNLKPEDTEQWNVGAEYQWATPALAVTAQADAYINRVDNRIVCLPMRGTYNWSMMNYGKTFCRGLNATINGNGRCGEWHVGLLASFSFQRDVNRTDPAEEMPVCYSPEFSCGITGIVAWRMLRLTVSDLHVAERIWSYADTEDVLAPYDNVDVKLTGTYRRLTASLEVNDLFDVQYEHIPRYPMPGRNFKFTIQFSL